MCFPGSQTRSTHLGPADFPLPHPTLEVHGVSCWPLWPISPREAVLPCGPPLLILDTCPYFLSKTWSSGLPHTSPPPMSHPWPAQGGLQRLGAVSAARIPKLEKFSQAGGGTSGQFSKARAGVAPCAICQEGGGDLTQCGKQVLTIGAGGPTVPLAEQDGKAGRCGQQVEQVRKEIDYCDSNRYQKLSSPPSPELLPSGRHRKRGSASPAFLGTQGSRCRTTPQGGRGAGLRERRQSCSEEHASRACPCCHPALDLREATQPSTSAQSRKEGGEMGGSGLRPSRKQMR